MELYNELNLAQSKEAAYLKQSLAFSLLANEKSDEALQAAKDSLSIFQLLADRRGEAAANNVLAQIYYSRKDKEKAISTLAEAKRLAEEVADADEAQWSQELHKEYTGGNKKKEEFRMTDSSGKAIVSQMVYMYYYGRDYCQFDEFVVRGTAERTAGGKSSSSSSGAHREITIDATKELEIG